MDKPNTIKKVKEGFVGQKMIVLPPDIITQLTENILTFNFYITAIGYYPRAHYHDRKRDYGSKEYILLYCVDGEGEVKIGHETHDLYPNAYAIIPPDVAHHYRSSLENSWSIFWVHFRGEEADYLYKKFKSAKRCIISKIPYAQEKVDAFVEAIDILVRDFSQDAIEYSCLLIKDFLCHLFYKKIDDAMHIEDSLVQKAKNYMKENMAKTIKIEDLASHFHLSVSRFTELYKEKTGYSPIQNFILLRIQKSCQFLYFTDLSVKEIAIKVGFEDPFYFSRMFKKLMGVAPTHYKKHYKK